MINIIDETAYFVNELLSNRLSQELVFHNLQHTHEVVNAAGAIGRASGLAERDWTALVAAAWFHDTGYCHIYKGHEKQSVNIAEQFLQRCGSDRMLRQQVKRIIEATCMPQVPANNLEKIICDADLVHLSQPDYLSYADRLRAEWEINLRKTYSDEDWRLLNIKFLTNHRYFTDYARAYWEPLKRINLQLLSKNT